ncbi:MAG: dihydrodipicolinate reductase [Desulfobacterales bacterium]|nr:dihydrodipicolinate reductase [Desulfobacterales bacterium]MCP4160165.1 dihydrodipicolinate reductase [Deltaproteobacteria bacterium]
MSKIKVMVNGIPGNVAVNVATHIINEPEMELVPWSLTGPEITDEKYTIDGIDIQLIKLENRDELIKQVKDNYDYFITVDYTHPTAVNINGDFYIKNNLPFVMGTTGGDRELLKENVRNSEISAIIAPNMAKQITGFQAIMEYAAKTFPGLFDGYDLTVVESHQKGKADTSGTAKAVIREFKKLGTNFKDEDLKMERNPEIQKKEWNIPEEHLGGHGWHTYTLDSNKKDVRFAFTHNINGRDIYSKGTIDGVKYLYNKKDIRGHVFTMIDVLKKN